MFKTLLERAKPGVVDAVMEQLEKYPHSYSRVFNFLCENHLCNDMPWSVWVDLRSCVFQKTKVLHTDPWELFEDL